MRPRGFALLWVMVAVATAGAALILRAEVPVQVVGTAIFPAALDSGELVVLLPAHHLDELAPGQQVLLEGPGARPEGLARIAAIEPAALGPDELRERWPVLHGSCDLPAPAAVAVVRCETPCREQLRGSILPARVILGHQDFLQRLMSSRETAQ